MARSPLFYVGDKYKLMPQLLELFPNNIVKYVEPFYGGGSSQLNVNANDYFLNDIDSNLIKLHSFLLEYKNDVEELFSKLFTIIDMYGLSCSYNNRRVVPIELKKQFPKTYYAKYNKEAYENLKRDYNIDHDIFKLYLLIIYGFNHMIRFNKSNEFNLPVGNVDFNKNVYNAITDYLNLQRNRNIHLYNLDFIDFINQIEIDGGDFVYLDPPYLISMSEYNKLWSNIEEERLYNFLDTLNARGIRFGITNLLFHKGKENVMFHNWSRNYNSIILNSNYISYNDNTIKEDSIELYVYNY